jgi:DNA-binding MarR family transcriptional regulator
MTRRAASLRRRLKPRDYRLLAEFRRLLRQFLVFSEQRAADVGLAPQQHQALLAIKGDLAERLAIRHHSAVGLVNRLVRAGYAVRRADRGDKRRVALKLTKDGEAILRKLTASHRDEVRRIAPLLKPLLAQLQD